MSFSSASSKPKLSFASQASYSRSDRKSVDPFPLHANLHLQCTGCEEEDRPQARAQTYTRSKIPPPPPTTPKTARPATYTKTAPKILKKSKPDFDPIKIPSLTNSGLNFLEEGNRITNPNARVISYNEGTGTSFGLHLLRKSSPMVGQDLHKKFRFKRDSDAEAVLIDEFQKRLGLTRPSHFDKENEKVEGPCLTRYKKGMFRVQRLTKEQIKKGLQFIQATNSPQKKILTSSEIDLIKKAAVQDTCGRITHHPKAKTRETCKRLCEAPSMTKELDELYKDYFDRCAPGYENTEDCRLLRHTAPPNRREPRRSILKGSLDIPNVRTSVASGATERTRRRSSFKPNNVKFEKNVGVMSTITKVPGIEAALEDQVGKLKLQKQITSSNGPAGHVPIYPPANIPKEEIYPLHVRDPKRFVSRLNPPPTNISEEEALETKMARQDLARIYFTQEATRIVACSNMGTVGRNALIRKEIVVAKRKLPHFFMDKLAADKEAATKQKKRDKIRALKNELDAFDDDVFRRQEDQPPAVETCSAFDPAETQPTEKSLTNVKLKVEILKRQRERDIQAAQERNRCRRAYFQQKILPSDFPEVIEQQIREYALNREPMTLSPEELELRQEFDEVIQQCRIFEENRRKWDREHLKFSPGRSREICQDIMNVIFYTAVETSEYTAIMGHEPAEELVAEWKEKLYEWVDDPKCETAEAAATCLDNARDMADVLVELAMNKSDYKAINGYEPLPSMVHHWMDVLFSTWLSFPECNNEKDAGGSPSASTRQAVTGMIDVMLELAVKIGDYKAEHGEEPTEGMIQEWRDALYSSIYGVECRGDEDDTGQNLAKNIVNVILDCVEKISDYRKKTGMQPSESMCQDWREQFFASIYDSECECQEEREETGEEIAQIMLDVILDTVVKASDYKYHTKQEAPSCFIEEWRDEIFSELQSQECVRKDAEYSSEQIIRDVLEVVQDIKKSDFYAKNGTQPFDSDLQQWRDYYYNLLYFVPCRTTPQDEENRLTEVLIRDILDEIVDAVAKISECKTKGDDLSADSSCLLWKQRGFLKKDAPPQEETQFQYCIRVMQETDEMIREIIEEIVDKAVNISECYKARERTEELAGRKCQRAMIDLESEECREAFSSQEGSQEADDEEEISSPAGLSDGGQRKISFAIVD